ncbi:hypothetical protein BDF21DRAFT_415101 [Thamnidium elegans]|uniref:Uncharacterized protein n=1 Tax=Thamnidium elegans TaxID=101142 RepID=A0A8H7SMU3_9FUNG|nr:hypothetical protein INT48_002947 [Thamnidium elegans]KAI8085408.1 hypothetical protein BDF21DRAFT_415101 [Thamnidium elegans]
MSFDNKSSVDSYPIGEDSWNRSKESRAHPELHSSGHGTVDRPWSDGPQQTDSSKLQQTEHSKKTDESNTDKKEHNFGGHTIKHPYSTRSVKRDLNNI